MKQLLILEIDRDEGGNYIVSDVITNCFGCSPLFPDAVKEWANMFEEMRQELNGDDDSKLGDGLKTVKFLVNHLLEG